MSVGNVTQAINFTNGDLILVIGENMDLGGTSNRNGVGKSTILNALSYALYGDSLVKIKKPNLINKINERGMLVTLTFEKDGNVYNVQRGRKPNIFKLTVNDSEYISDESQGDSRQTQEYLDSVIGITHEMFKQIVCLAATNEPFLSMRSHDQRAIIEQLLGITKLSKKAEILRDQMKTIKDEIKSEEFKIIAKKETNNRIEKNIQSLKIKSKAWDKNQQETILLLEKTIASMESLDIDEEIKKHEQNTKIREEKRKILEIDKEIQLLKREQRKLVKQQKLLKVQLESTNNEECPVCRQSLDTDTHHKLHTELSDNMNSILEELDEIDEKLNKKMAELGNFHVLDEHDTFYDTLEQAYNHRSDLQELTNNHQRELNLVNPYTEQIDSLKKHGLQQINMDYITELNTHYNHQDFLLKLLINKDSFIRKKIIDQNLSFLNSRLSHYTQQLGLPHEVKFKSDLEVEITHYGRDYDFDNLSRGEKTRLILSLSWSFREVFESMNETINIMLIDELIDNGLDVSGGENALHVLKQQTRDNGRNIFLISHKEELIGRVSSVMRVVKEGGFTTFDTSESD